MALGRGEVGTWYFVLGGEDGTILIFLIADGIEPGCVLWLICSGPPFSGESYISLTAPLPFIVTILALVDILWAGGCWTFESCMRDMQHIPILHGRSAVLSTVRDA